MPNKQLKKRNPSLRTYFSYMMAKSEVTLQFTHRKIREIIQFELNVRLGEFSDLVQDVSTQAFQYYIQSWPGWGTIERGMNMEELYGEFRGYLRAKIVGLREMEKKFVLNSGENEYAVELPTDALEKLPDTSTYKIRSPYTLEISGKSEFLSCLNFSKPESCPILTLQYPLKTPPGSPVTNKIALNHPFVSVELKIPNLINFTRKNVYTIDMFLSKAKDTWYFPPHEHIVEIEKFPPWSNVYTLDVMELFFAALYKVITNYSTYFGESSLKLEIWTVCNELIKDIIEANVNQKTIQECSKITYHLGSSIFYSDSTHRIEQLINFRKIYIPQMQYSLIYCFIQQNDVRSDGTFKNFDFANYKRGNRTALTSAEMEFINNVTNCLSYNCTMCNLAFKNMSDLRMHLTAIHPNYEILICSKCGRNATFYEVINYRWIHDCQPKETKPQD